MMQGGADGPGRITTAQREHTTAPAQRYGRGGQQVTRQIDHVLQVVPVPQARHRKSDHRVDLPGVQSGRAAGAAMQAFELGHADRSHALPDVSLQEAPRQAFTIGQAGDVADV